MNTILSHHFFWLFIILNILNYSFCTIEIGQFALSSRLNNGNYIILSSGKIVFADPTLSTILNQKTITDTISSNSNADSMAVTQFKSIDNGYIIGIVLKTIYIFTSNGDFCSQLTDETDINPANTCSLITKNHVGNLYYFVLITASGENGNTNRLLFKNYNFDSSTNTTTAATEGNVLYQPYENSYSPIYASTSCELMNNKTEEYIVCLYGHESHFSVTVFNKNNYSFVATQDDSQGGQYFKSAVMHTTRENGVFCGYKSGSSLYCFYYDITSNILNNKIKINDSGCRSQPASLNIQYFYETEQFVIGCAGDSSIFFLSQASEDLTSQTNSQITLPSVTSIDRINIVLPEGESSYNLFGQNIQTELGGTLEIKHSYPVEEETLTCSDPQYYSYNRTVCLDSIPDGYYCNSTTERTLNKCHENCKTCGVGPTANNNSCTKCQDTGKEYYDWGNCLSESECDNGVFTDADDVKRCKCRTQEKCLLCDSTSSLCLVCDTENGYYAKSDDTNEYVECYNTKPDGYYLNNVTKKYEPCFTNCQTCNALGSTANHKCQTCKSEFELMKNIYADFNCETPCSNYYYFNYDNEYVCLTNNECPDGYKLIFLFFSFFFHSYF